MTNTQTWQNEYTIETTATPEALWTLFRDVPGWTSWNSGIDEIEIGGPFAVGTTFTMKPTGQDALQSRLVEVRENECFVDETRLDDLVITVAHRIERLVANRSRVTYANKAAGPGAPDIGPTVAADFPDVLSSLVRCAESQVA